MVPSGEPTPRVQMENGKTPSRGGLPHSPWLLVSLSHTYHSTITQVPYELFSLCNAAMTSQPNYQLFVCPSCVLSDLTFHQSAFMFLQPIWVLGGCVRLLVVVFCPSVLLTGLSIWATAHVINQMEISPAGTGSVIDTVGVFFCWEVYC